MSLPAKREPTPLAEAPVIKDPADPSGMGSWVVFVDVIEILAERIGPVIFTLLLGFVLLRWFNSLADFLQVGLSAALLWCLALIAWPLFAYYIRRKAHLKERRKIYESQVHGGARAANEAEVHAALMGRDPAAQRRDFDE